MAKKSRPRKKAAPPGPKPRLSITVTHPFPYGKSKVQEYGTGAGFGKVECKGHVSGASIRGPIYGKVYQALPVPFPLDPGAVSAHQLAANVDKKHPQFKGSLDAVDCSLSAGSENLLVVWVKARGRDKWTILIEPFLGAR